MIDLKEAMDSHTQSPIVMTDIIPTWRGGRFTNTENASTTASVKLHGIIKPMIVTKKLHNQQGEHQWIVSKKSESCLS